MLYEPNIKLKELTFEDLFYRMKPRIEFHCHHNSNLIPGFDFDDLFQELSFKLWRVKIPKDIEFFDWRYLRYMDLVFRNHLFDLSRQKIIKLKGEDKVIMKDRLDTCTFLDDLRL